MKAVGLEPSELFAFAATAVQLGGSTAIVLNRGAWLGAGALGGFLALMIPRAHPFWLMPEPRRTMGFYIVLEHICLIGRLMVAAVLAYRPEPARPVAGSSAR